jgi:hypothetical protein
MLKSTVHDIITRNTAESKRRMGRPKVLTPRDKRRIDLYIKRDKTTRRQPPEVVIKELDLQCSVSTFRRALKELGYRRCVARKRPLLKKIDFKRRLQFARIYKH